MTSDTRAAPVFVLSSARSGSTLTRYLLDAHPDVCCPGEIGLGALCRHLLCVFDSTPAAAGAPARRDAEPARSAPDALAPARQRAARRRRWHPTWMDNWPSSYSRSDSIARTREVASAIMADYARSKGKRVWCDRTPENVEELDVLQAVFPEAKYVCLYRNCLDVVSSCLTGTRFGLMHEFADYVQREPANAVAAMIDMWCDVTDAMLAFERDSTQCFRLHYEAIVYRPEDTLRPLFEFIGVPWDAGLVERAFLVSHDAGVGDRNANATGKIATNRVGKGSEIPLSRIPSDRLGRLNALLSSLDYPTVGPDWERIRNPYVQASAASGADPAAGAAATTPDEVMAVAARALRNPAVSTERGTILVVVRGNAGGTWIVDLGERRVSRGTVASWSCRVTIAPEVLVGIANGSVTAVQGFESGKLSVDGDAALAGTLGRLISA